MEVGNGREELAAQGGNVRHAPAGAVRIKLKVQKPMYAWIRRLAKFYGVLPAAVVERGVRLLARKAQDEGIPEDFEGLTSLREIPRR